MICKPTTGRKKLILGIIGILMIVGLYSFLSYRQHQSNPQDTTIPNLSQIIEGINKSCIPNSRGEIWIVQDCWATGLRLFMGLGIGVFSAIVLGMIMGCYKWIGNLLFPIIVFSAKVPVTAMMAVWFVIFGINDTLIVAIICLGIIPSFVSCVYYSVSNDVNENIIFKAYTLGASDLDVIESVIFRQIFPRTIQFIQSQIGPAMIYLIAVEWLIANVGFGYRLRMQSRLLNMNVVYFYIFLLGIFGLLCDKILDLITKKTCPWFKDK